MRIPISHMATHVDLPAVKAYIFYNYLWRVLDPDAAKM